MKMFSASQRNPTRYAICKIVSKSKESTMMLLKMIDLQSHNKEHDNIPHHLLSSIIHEDIETLILLLTTLENFIIDGKQDEYSETYHECLIALMGILKYSVSVGNKSAPIASELTANSLAKLHNLLRIDLEQDLMLAMMKKDSSIEIPDKMIKTDSKRYLKGESAKMYMKEYKKHKIPLTQEI